MSGDTEREALIRILVEVERGKMTEVEWKVASLTPANGIRADAILAEFLPDHDKRLRAEAAERAWREGYYTGKRDYAGSITGGMPISTPNPYERRES